MTATLKAIPSRQVQLGESLFQQRFGLNQRYLMSLKSSALLQSHYQEAGLLGIALHQGSAGEEEMHWGWESPTCQVRGHFLGHWLSAAAKIHAATGDPEVKLKADRIVSELGRCQASNGGEWAGSIPEKYLGWISGELPRQGIWAPQYVLHKTLMGLQDMFLYTDSEEALEIWQRFARWFHRWTGGFSREAMDQILEVETGGMLEAWANLYGVTGRPEHLELVYRYDRPRLFEPLLAGEDILTNRHANTTIPEAQGAARAYEVTGDARWRRIAEAYWKCAVTDRGTFCTGGQTSGEIWTPPFSFAARLGDKNQEHCTVYNMIRLAEYLFRWTGQSCFSDYIERNLYNGILAQQHPQTGMIAYFLPLEAGARKRWGHPTRDFWCCHGSLVQAQASYPEWIWLEDAAGPLLSQYIPSRVEWTAPDGTQVALSLSAWPSGGSASENDSPARESHRPAYGWHEVSVACSRPVAFTLKLRLPEWLGGPVRITINGSACPADASSGFLALHRTWHNDTISLSFPGRLRACPIPDEPERMAFLDGPAVLAGLCQEERLLYGDPENLAALLAPDNEREWGTWLPGYRTIHQPNNLRFLPLYAIADESYTVYFPVRKACRKNNDDTS